MPSSPPRVWPAPLFIPNSETKFLPPPTPAPLPEPMPPPEPPPKPLELPPPIAPAVANGFAIVGTLLIAIDEFAFLLVMRELVLVSALTFLGWSLVLYSLAFGPPLPPPAPVAKVSDPLFLALSVTVETTQTMATITSRRWMMTEKARPSPPRRRQSERLGLSSGGEGVASAGSSWGEDIRVFH